MLSLQRTPPEGTLDGSGRLAPSDRGSAQQRGRVAPRSADTARWRGEGGARGAAWRRRTADQEQGMKVKVFNCHGALTGPVETPRVVKTDAEWRRQLTAQ